MGIEWEPIWINNIFNGFSDLEINHGQINLTKCSSGQRLKYNLVILCHFCSLHDTFWVLFILLLYTTVITMLPHGSKGIAVKKKKNY